MLLKNVFTHATSTSYKNSLTHVTEKKNDIYIYIYIYIYIRRFSSVQNMFKLIMVIGLCGVRYSPRGESSICLITSMITDRTRQHEALLLWTIAKFVIFFWPF